MQTPGATVGSAAPGTRITIGASNSEGSVEYGEFAVPTGSAEVCRYIVRVSNHASEESVADDVLARVAARDPAAPAGRARAAQKAAREAAGIHVYGEALHGFVASMTRKEAKALARDPRVVSVTPDARVTVADNQVSPPWGLDRIDQRGLPLDGGYTYDPTGGADVKAYVIDTGILSTHTDFGGRVAAGASFVEGSTSTKDCHGHGTHVAGTIGGTTYGVAKSATLVPVRVLDCGGSGYMSWIIAGLDWVIADHQAGTPAVANLSLGGGFDADTNDAIARAVADGVVVVVAAGNSSADACAYSPASAPAALTVGASDNTDRYASFSNWGTCLDLYAPGVGVTSDYFSSDTATQTMSGTSMATPHVAGIAAVLFGRYPTADAATIGEMILGEATRGAMASRHTGDPDRLSYLPGSTPGPQTIYLGLPALYLGDAPAALHGISTSGQVPAYSSLTPSVCTVASGVVTAVAQGTCTVHASVPGGGGWDATTTDTSTPVYRYRQTVTVPTWWVEFPWGTSNTPGATASSGLPVAYRSLSPMCTISGGLVVSYQVGDCQIVASQAGANGWGPAPDVPFWRTVVPATQSLSGPAGAAVAVGGSVAYEATSSAGLPVDVLSASLETCATTQGMLHGLTAGQCALRLTQGGSAGVRPTGSTALRAVSSATPWFTRLALDAAGRPVIAYSVANELHLLRCGDTACTSSSDTLVADVDEHYSSSPWTGLPVQDLAIVVADGRPFIAYVETAPRPKPGQDYVDIDYVLRVLSCADATCSTWTDRIIDNPDPLADVQVDTVTMTTSAAGAPILAWGGGNNGARMYFCADAACETGVTRTIAGSYPDDFGIAPAVAVGPNGLAVVAYLRGVQNPSAGNLEEWTNPVIARCLDSTCSLQTKTQVGEAMRWYKPAVVVPADNRPVVFWTQDASVVTGGPSNYRVMSARCGEAACATASARVLDATPYLQTNGDPFDVSLVGRDLSAAVGPDGLPRVSYVGLTRYAPQSSLPSLIWAVIESSCSNADCSVTRRTVLDEWSRSSSMTPRSTEIDVAVAADGTLRTAFGTAPGAYSSTDPLISGVKVATCAMAVCGTSAAAAVVSDVDPPTAALTAPATPTSAATLSYTLTFSESVTGLAAADFTRTGTATGCTVNAPAGSAANYTVTVTGCGDGTVILALGAGTVSDGVGNPGPATPATAATVTRDATAPSSSGSVTATTTSGTSLSVDWTASDGTGSGLASVTAYYSTSAALTSPVSCGSAAGTATAGTITCTIPAVDATYQLFTRATDAAGNTEAAPGTGDDSIVRDSGAPTATLTRPTTPTRATTLTYALAFSESVTGLALADFTRTGTATGCVVGTPTGSGASYTVPVTGCSAGTVILALKANSVADAAGNAGPAAAVTAGTVTIDRTLPTATAPVVSLRTGVAVSGTAVPVALAWTGADNAGGSGIARYELAKSTDGGTAWTTVSTTLTASPYATTTAPSGTVRYRIRAVDRAGNTGAWMTGPVLVPRLVQETGPGLTYTGTWTTASSASYSGGCAPLRHHRGGLGHVHVHRALGRPGHDAGHEPRAGQGLPRRRPRHHPRHLCRGHRVRAARLAGDLRRHRHPHRQARRGRHGRAGRGWTSTPWRSPSPTPPRPPPRPPRSPCARGPPSVARRSRSRSPGPVPTPRAVRASPATSSPGAPMAAPSGPRR